MDNEKIFSVAVHYGDTLGYIDFDADTHRAEVSLADEAGRRRAEAYLAEKHEINLPRETLMDFATELIDPLADVRSFKIALTRLWEETEVYVDWSRPVDFVKKYPTLDSLPKGGVEYTPAT